eukprot:TRINITY_DN9505_c0_g1_i1.p1 TRINITY_DN9505_c0_g1~~TRINITY_DN9505_c0_g1_i1.p1  ORF type:complete len:792 (+),score=139.41 TRINITY_DN9505_c0_g1_i1:66-2441(+)
MSKSSKRDTTLRLTGRKGRGELPTAVGAPDSVIAATVTELLLDDNGLHTLPATLSHYRVLFRLTLARNAFTAFPPCISALTSLVALDLAHNAISQLPPDIANLRLLMQLDLSHNRLTDLPREMMRLSNLQTLSIGNAPQHRSSQIGGIEGNSFSEIPTALLGGPPLRDLQLDGLVHLTDGKGLLRPINVMALVQISTLQTIHLRNIGLTELPIHIASLQRLQQLHLDGNDLSQFDSRIARAFTQAKSVNLAFMKITQIPLEIFEKLQTIQIRILDLSHNQIQEIPSQIGSLFKLEQLFLQSNKISALPKSIGKLHMLTHLDVTFNPIHAVPPQILCIPALETMKIDSLPLARGLTLPYFILGISDKKLLIRVELTLLMMLFLAFIFSYTCQEQYWIIYVGYGAFFAIICGIIISLSRDLYIIEAPSSFRLPRRNIANTVAMANMIVEFFQLSSFPLTSIYDLKEKVGTGSDFFLLNFTENVVAKFWVFFSIAVLFRLSIELSITWPRLFLLTRLTTLLFIPTIQNLAKGLTCSFAEALDNEGFIPSDDGYDDDDDDDGLVENYTPECWSDTHVAHVVMSLFALTLFVPTAIICRPLWQEREHGASLSHRSGIMVTLASLYRSTMSSIRNQFFTPSTEERPPTREEQLDVLFPTEMLLALPFLQFVTVIIVTFVEDQWASLGVQLTGFILMMACCAYFYWKKPSIYIFWRGASFVGAVWVVLCSFYLYDYEDEPTGPISLWLSGLLIIVLGVILATARLLRAAATIDSSPLISNMTVNPNSRAEKSLTQTYT